MDKFDRIYQLHGILRGRRTAIGFEELRASLECSKATLHRLIAILKDQLNAPVVFDKGANGYRYESAGGAVAAFELPGLWFSPAELQALVILHRLLQDLGGGLLEAHLAPLTRRLEELMSHRRLNLTEVASRLRFPALGARPVGPAFALAAAATLQRQQLRIRYYGRGRNEHTERTISPQRIIHYRESWYLDAWDEDKGDFRSFSMDRIEEIVILPQRARDIPDAELDAHYASSYGIFSGRADNVAVLRFTPERARWVADEQWHPQQEAQWLADGAYELRIPYHDPRELVMDILRHGPHVKVIAPPALQAAISEQLRAALALYAGSASGGGLE